MRPHTLHSRQGGSQSESTSSPRSSLFRSKNDDVRIICATTWLKRVGVSVNGECACVIILPQTTGRSLGPWSRYPTLLNTYATHTYVAEHPCHNSTVEDVVHGHYNFRFVSGS